MRIINWKHFPWFFFVCFATLAASLLYLGNFYPHLIYLPPSWMQTPTEHHTVGGTPLGLAFGTISLGIFIFAALLSLRKKIPLWRIGNVQRWLRAHIWLTFLTIPLVLMHCGFRLGGPMTTLLMVLYAIVMISGIYGLIIQHHLPRLMKERLPVETVFEQIPHIRSQLCVAAEKMRDSFKPAPPAKAGAGPPVSTPAKAAPPAPSAAMASTKGGLSTPTARPKSATGSAPVATPVTAAPALPPAAAKSETTPDVTAPRTVATNAPPVSVANPAATETKKTETISGPTPQEIAVPKPAEEPAKVEAKTEATTEVKTEAKVEPTSTTPAPKPAPDPPAKPAAAAVAKPAVVTAAKPAAAVKAALPSDPESEAALAEFIDRQILPYLRARRGERYRLGDARFSDDTFRFVKLGVSEAYRGRVEEIQGWCDERRLLDLQTRLHHWLHGWLFIHVPFSFLLLMLTIWHACVTLFYY